jgi:hypothetical protein
MTHYGDPEGTFSSIRTTASGNETESYRATPQFAVSLGKLTVMSIVTIGMYDLYWAYKQWDAIQRRENEDLSPLWRAFFAPVWSFSLFPRIQKLAEMHRVPVNWSGGALAVIYLLLCATWRLPDPIWLIMSLVTFLPILMVQRTINDLNAAVAPEAPRNGTYSGANIIWIFVGGVMVLLVLVGMLMPSSVLDR